MILRDAKTTSVYGNYELPILDTVIMRSTYLTVEPDTAEVDHDDEYQKYRDPDRRIDRIIPELY